MDDTSEGEPLNEVQIHWAHCRRRCFGDKGDVEDITEGWFPQRAVASFEHGDR